MFGQGGLKNFERSFSSAKNIISSMPGYISHELHRCIEVENKFLLLVRWQRLEDHIEGFRKSAEYQEWKRLLHGFYDPFPIIEHYEELMSRDADRERI